MIQENGIFVEFFTAPVEQTYLSKKEGRPIFKDMAHVRMAIPGDRNNSPVFIATDQHKRRFREAWRDFERNGQQNETGTPIGKLPGITKSQTKEVEHFNIRTVEQMAIVSDAAISNMGVGYQDLRARAKAYLEVSQKRSQDTEFQEVREEADRAKKELAQMRAELDAMKTQKEEAEQPKRGPGRPTKSEE